jgi:hypothetical protein
MVKGLHDWSSSRIRLRPSWSGRWFALVLLLSCTSSAWGKKPLLQFATSSIGSSGAGMGCNGCKGVDDALGQPQLAEYQSCSNAYGLAWEPDNNLDR